MSAEAEGIAFILNLASKNAEISNLVEEYRFKYPDIHDRYTVCRPLALLISDGLFSADEVLLAIVLMWIDGSCRNLCITYLANAGFFTSFKSKIFGKLMAVLVLKGSEEIQHKTIADLKSILEKAFTAEEQQVLTTIIQENEIQGVKSMITLPAAFPPTAWDVETIQRELEVIKLIQDEEGELSPFHPSFVTPIPNISDMLEEDEEDEGLLLSSSSLLQQQQQQQMKNDGLIWLIPDDQQEHPLLWAPIIDHSYEIARDELRILLTEASLKPLNLSQITKVNKQLKTMDYMEWIAFVSLEKILGIMINNRPLVIDILVYISQPSATFPSITTGVDLFQSFLNYCLEPSSLVTSEELEVTSAVHKKITLPIDFLKSYLLKCMQQTSDVNSGISQPKLIRTICAFTSYLLTALPQLIIELSVELQSYCLSYATIPEATTLYSSIKLLEGS